MNNNLKNPGVCERLEISERLKKLRRKKRYSQAFIAEKLFVSQSAYSLMEGTQNSITAEHIVRLSKLFEVTTDYLLTGNKKIVEMNTKNGFLPLINAKAHAGFLKNAHQEDVMDDFEYYRIPGFNPTKDSILIEIEGVSMQPAVLSGDILVCQTQKNLDYVLDGSIVIIVTDGELLITRIFLHENKKFFRIESDNPDDDDKKEIKKSEIIQLLIVMGKVSNILIPHRELAFKGKLKTLEESIQSLNKEVFKISEKLNIKDKK